MADISSAPESDPVWDIGNGLLHDPQAVFKKKLLDLLIQEQQRVNAVLQAGAPADEFETLTQLAKALDKAQGVISAYWDFKHGVGR